MDPAKTSEDRDQAYEQFKRIIDVHMSALSALRLMVALPEAEHGLAALLHLRQGMGPNRAQPTLDFAGDLIALARLEQEDQFATLRGLTLVSACGALEYLLKATFVDLAATDLGAATKRINSLKLRLPAADVLGLQPVEQWHQIADAALLSLGQDFPRMHSRASALLLKYAPNPWGEDDHRHLSGALTEPKQRLLDEAFLVRNCLVHGGGKVSSTLAHFRGAPANRGQPIRLDSASGPNLIAVLRDFADAVVTLGRGYV